MDRAATTDAEIAHVDELSPSLMVGIVKVTLMSGLELIGCNPQLGRQQTSDGVVCTVTLTALDGQQVPLNLLDVARAENVFAEYRDAFAKAGLVDLRASNTLH